MNKNKGAEHQELGHNRVRGQNLRRFRLDSKGKGDAVVQEQKSWHTDEIERKEKVGGDISRLYFKQEMKLGLYMSKNREAGAMEGL